MIKESFEASFQNLKILTSYFLISCGLSLKYKIEIDLKNISCYNVCHVTHSKFSRIYLSYTNTHENL